LPIFGLEHLARKRAFTKFDVTPSLGTTTAPGEFLAPFAPSPDAVSSETLADGRAARPLISLGMFGTGALPPATGVLVSVGGNSMESVRREYLQKGR